jgi:hypothetical protein
MKLASIALLMSAILIVAACEPEPSPEANEWKPGSDLTEQFFEPQGELRLERSQVLYAPVYSSILTGTGEPPQELAATLAIRNIDPSHPIYVTAVEYYDNDGNLIETYLDGVHGLKPLASASLVVNVSDTRGGVGANFLIKWGAEAEVSQPIVETIMMGSSGTKAFAFSSSAKIIGNTKN